MGCKILSLCVSFSVRSKCCMIHLAIRESSPEKERAVTRCYNRIPDVCVEMSLSGSLPRLYLSSILTSSRSTFDDNADIGGTSCVAREA